MGSLLLGACLVNLLMIPHPVWFWVAATVVLVAGTFVGTRLAGTGTTPAAV